MSLINAPYVVFSTKKRKIESLSELNDDTSVFLSTRDGVLLSLTEEFPFQGKGSSCSIRLYDPRGTFLLSLLQARNNAFKDFLSLLKTEFSESQDDTEYDYGKAINAFENPVKIEEIKEGDEFSLSQLTAESSQKLEVFNHKPRVFIKYGVGDLSNSTPWRLLEITNFYMSQDTSEPYTVVIDGTFQIEEDDKNAQSDYISSDGFGSPNTFPYGVGLDRRLYNLITTDAVYQPNGEAKYIFKTNVISNTNRIPYLTNMIEMLLQDYLCNNGTDPGSDPDSPIPVIFLSNELQQKFLEGYSDPAAAGSEVQSGFSKFASWYFELVRRLESCGIRVYSETDSDPVSYVSNSQEAMRTKHYLFIEVDDSKTKTWNVKRIVNNLYREFGVQDYNFESTPIDCVDHSEIFIKYLFTDDGDNYVDYYDLDGIQDYILKISKSRFEDGLNQTVMVLGNRDALNSVIFPLPQTGDPGDVSRYAELVTSKFTPTAYTTYRSNLDKMLGGNYNKYVKEVWESYSYGTVEGEERLPEEFAYQQPSIKKKSILEKYKFINCNTFPTDVISLRLKRTNNQMGRFAELTNFDMFSTLGPRKTLDILSSSYKTELEEGDKLTDQKIEDIIFLLSASNLKDVPGQIHMEQLLKRNLSNSEMVGEYEDQLKDILTKVNETSVVNDKAFDKSTFLSYVNFLRETRRLAQQVIVKVTPDYRVSGSYFRGKPVFLYHKNPKAIGVENPFTQTSFLSGQYHIMGYTHVLSESECYTELNLQQTDYTAANPSNKLNEEAESKNTL